MKPEAKASNDASTPRTPSLLANYLQQLQSALGQILPEERQKIYLRALADLSEDQLADAFRHAILHCKFIPTIAELRDYTLDAAIVKHQKHTQTQTRALLGRTEKPDDWNFKLDDVWQEIEKRRDYQERQDLMYSEPFTDEEVLAAVRIGKYPGRDRFADWQRRYEARKRFANHMPRPSARAELGVQLDAIIDSARDFSATFEGETDD